MKALLLALLLWQAAESTRGIDADPRYFRYERAVTWSAPAPKSGVEEQACATLDAAVYAHAAPSLKDVRLFQGAREVPYAITLSESAESDSEPAKVINLGMRGRRIVFDLEMPSRPYTDVTLDLNGHDFIASAEVSGTEHPGSMPTRLGTFTLFDLSGQHLSHSTTLHLQESSFHVLHVELSFAAPFAAVAAMVRGATVPPDREAQTLYTTVSETTIVTQRGRRTVAKFRLPAHVPVERFSFSLAPDFSGNFSRGVAVTGRMLDPADSAMETLTGTILRVRMSGGGRDIRQQQLSVPATLGANLQTDAAVEVLIDNGNDTPLPIAAVRLEMRERRLCFTAAEGATLRLLYGDAALDAPVYDYGRLMSVTGSVAAAKLGAEQRNPVYAARPEPLRPLTERHPELLWVALLGVVCVLAVVALHSAKRMPR